MTEIQASSVAEARQRLALAAANVRSVNAKPAGKPVPEVQRDAVLTQVSGFLIHVFGKDVICVHAPEGDSTTITVSVPELAACIPVTVSEACFQRLTHMMQVDFRVTTLRSNAAVVIQPKVWGGIFDPAVAIRVVNSRRLPDGSWGVSLSLLARATQELIDSAAAEVRARGTLAQEQDLHLKRYADQLLNILDYVESGEADDVWTLSIVPTSGLGFDSVCSGPRMSPDQLGTSLADLVNCLTDGHPLSHSWSLYNRTSGDLIVLGPYGVTGVTKLATELDRKHGLDLLALFKHRSKIGGTHPTKGWSMI